MDAGAQKMQKKTGELLSLKVKKANDMAWAPAKNFMPTALMLWMSGNGVHIFSIMITFYAVYNPIKSALNVANMFSPLHDPAMSQEQKLQLLASKLLFVALNLLSMIGALYKMSLMGLLPNTPSDWVSYLSVPPPAQFSFGGPSWV